MVGTIKPERQQLKEHAVTLRKQGWTEQPIADNLGVTRPTISVWLRGVFDNNATLGNTSKSWHIDNNRNRNNVSYKPLFNSFLGNVEDFQTDRRFPLIIADPAWNISAENSRTYLISCRQVHYIFVLCPISYHRSCRGFCRKLVLIRVLLRRQISRRRLFDLFLSPVNTIYIMSDRQIKPQHRRNYLFR